LPDVEDVQRLLEKAQNGDASTLPALRKILENANAVDQIGGNFAEQAERLLLKAAAGENLLFEELVKRKMELLRAELGGPNSTPLERLLAERIVACWLQVQDADARYAQSQSTNLSWEGGTYYQRRMDRAHKRYLSAIKTLAVVRKLAVPVLQVNIARKQVNVAGPCVVADSKADNP
jgi:hypothetical protein